MLSIECAQTYHSHPYRDIHPRRLPCDTTATHRILRCNHHRHACTMGSMTPCTFELYHRKHATYGAWIVRRVLSDDGFLTNTFCAPFLMKVSNITGMTDQRVAHLFQDDDLVTLGRSGEAVRHEEGGPPGCKPLQRVQDLLLRPRIQCRRRFITQQNGRLLRLSGTGYSESLLRPE